MLAVIEKVGKDIVSIAVTENRHEAIAYATGLAFQNTENGSQEAVEKAFNAHEAFGDENESWSVELHNVKSI